MERTLKAIEEILDAGHETLAEIEDRYQGAVTPDCPDYTLYTKTQGRIEGLELARKMLAAEAAEARNLELGICQNSLQIRTEG